jgi:hypothetical protein
MMAAFMSLSLGEGITIALQLAILVVALRRK